MTLGMRLDKTKRESVRPSSSVSSSSTIFTTFCAGVSEIEHLGGEAALLRTGDESLDHFEVDVRLEQGKAILAHSSVDIVLGQAPLGPQTRENALKALGKIL